MNYLWFLLWYAGPFIALGVLYLVWAHTARKLENRFPALYNFALRLHDNLPKVAGIAVIALVIVLYFTQPSYYDW